MWNIYEPTKGILLLANQDAVWLRSELGSLTDLKFLKSLPHNTRLGRLLPTLIPQLLELGLATEVDDTIRIANNSFIDFPEQGIDAFEGIVDWSPFTLELESYGNLGWGSFGYKYRFQYASQLIYPERLGCFLRRNNKVYQLDKQIFLLVQTIDDFNNLPSDGKKGKEAFIKFANIKGLAETIGLELDAYLTRQRVIIPSHIGIDIKDEDGKLYFIPKVDGVNNQTLADAFLQRDDIHQVYPLLPANGGGVHIVLSEMQQEALCRMQRVRALTGVDRVKILQNPHAVFDGVSEVVDLTDIGPRIKGIGNFPFIAQPYLERTSIGIFDASIEREGNIRKEKVLAGVECQDLDGNIKQIVFPSPEELLKFRNDAKVAFETGKGTIEHEDISILLDHSFIKSMDELAATLFPTNTNQKALPINERKYLLIYTNDEVLEYEEASENTYKGIGGDFDLELPKSLKPDVELKHHQRAGIAWLQRNFRMGRKGCLLADDMGMGKSLQVLTFLAWLIEKHGIHIEKGDPDTGPYRPILIVMPVILLDNETWLNDMRKFFKDEGSIFLPYLHLHGKTLNKVRKTKQQETVIGEPVLNLDEIKKYRVILTNYDTIVNYQFSFACLKRDLSIVVTDEAQEHKTPNTKISHALKSLSPEFRIACTGTPVETRLLDIWNIFDYLQPGNLLGSANAFRNEYEKPLDNNSPDVLNRLKKRLQYNQPSSYLLRREKTGLPGLPQKYEQTVLCDLSPEQRAMHLDIVASVKSGGSGHHPLSLIHQLMKLYQHPALFPQYNPISPKEAIDRCPKLAAVIKSLHNIKRKNEKALIFTRTLDMQQMLVNVLFAEFGINIDIINGATNRNGDTKSSQLTRKNIVKRFQDSYGFNVLVLSPDVAGIGLTLVEANHVIHYGRWWNPAKEAQATDRVYRIGQTKDVHVYYPISRDPESKFKTFDEKLDLLITQRKNLAEDFLAPRLTESELEQELLSDIINSPDIGNPTQIPALSIDDVRLLNWDRFEALIALLERKQGAKTILTPKSGDNGIDIISFRQREIRLIQCKHSHSDLYIGQEVIAELILGFDYYKANYFRQIPTNTKIKLVVFTNGRILPTTYSEAKDKDIQILSTKELEAIFKKLPCTLGEVEYEESLRLISSAELSSKINQLGFVSR
jgi:SNF2 family DNA or RNA helicase